jgi:3'-phosphoadenosine 5'-phosphosulfate sulfotransferase (PAPS reductase)/FAD synthetase
MSTKKDVALLHSRSRSFKAKLLKTEKILVDASENLSLDRWYVALSGGKDSTVVANLLPQCPRLYVDEEWLLPETDAYLSRQNGLHRIKKRDQHAEWFTVWVDDDEAWTGKNVTGRYAASQGWEGVFLGLRAEESSDRRRHLRCGGVLFFNKSRTIWQCNPIAWWGWLDVWAFIFSRGLDYNEAYDVLDEIGVDPSRQRIGPLAQRRVLGYGQISILRRGWPELFDKFADKFPEARSYV